MSADQRQLTTGEAFVQAPTQHATRDGAASKVSRYRIINKSK